MLFTVGDEAGSGGYGVERTSHIYDLLGLQVCASPLRVSSTSELLHRVQAYSACAWSLTQTGNLALRFRKLPLLRARFNSWSNIITGLADKVLRVHILLPTPPYLRAHLAFGSSPAVAAARWLLDAC